MRPDGVDSGSDFAGGVGIFTPILELMVVGLHA